MNKQEQKRVLDFCNQNNIDEQEIYKVLKYFDFLNKSILLFAKNEVLKSKNRQSLGWKEYETRNQHYSTKISKLVNVEERTMNELNYRYTWRELKCAFEYIKKNKLATIEFEKTISNDLNKLLKSKYKNAFLQYTRKLSSKND